MKNNQKRLLILLFAFFTMSATYAQDKSPLKLYAGLNYGTDISELGIAAGVEFGLAEKINLAPNFTYFFTPSEFSAYSISADGKYIFTDGGPQIYGLLGLTIGIVSVDLGPGSVTSSEFGINVGAGITQPISDKISFNGQLRYNTPFEQVEFMAGVLIGL